MYLHDQLQCIMCYAVGRCSISCTYTSTIFPVIVRGVVIILQFTYIVGNCLLQINCVLE